MVIGESRGTLGEGEVEHLGHTSHLMVVEMVPGPLEHTLGGRAADVVLKDKLAREGGALLGDVTAVHDHKEGVGVGWVTRYIYVLSTREGRWREDKS